MESQLLIDRGSFTVSGRSSVPMGNGTERRPLIVAIHGGGFTSRYFDIPGHSLLERAIARGHGIIAIDRLGYGQSSAAGGTGQSLAASADWLDEAIGRLWRQFAAEYAGVVLVGHSIGAALSLMVAARGPDWPLLGVAVSGTGLTPNAALDGYFDRLPADEWIEPAPDAKDGLMFGRSEAVPDGVIALVRAAYEPASSRELHEIHEIWPKNSPAVLRDIAVPVHFRLAEQEMFYVVNDGEADAIRRLLRHPDSDVAIVADTGHCIDFHRAGAALHEAQLDFAVRCCRAA